MTKYKFLTLAALCVAQSSPVRAQTTPPPAPVPVATAKAPMRMQAGLDLSVAVPLGDFGDATGVGLGALLRYEHAVHPKLNVTGRAGFIYSLPETRSAFGISTKTTFWTVPILAGVKFSLHENFYLAGELGVFSNHSAITITSFGTTTEAKASETDLGMTAGAGFRAGDIDLRVGLQTLNLGEATDTMALAFNVGFNPWIR